MSYRHVEDTESKTGEFEGNAVGETWTGRYFYREKSTKTVAHSIWRCSHCRALCVTQKGTSPPVKCAKCGC